MLADIVQLSDKNEVITQTFFLPGIVVVYET